MKEISILDTFVRTNLAQNLPNLRNLSIEKLTTTSSVKREAFWRLIATLLRQLPGIKSLSCEHNILQYIQDPIPCITSFELLTVGPEVALTTQCFPNLLSLNVSFKSQLATSNTTFLPISSLNPRMRVIDLSLLGSEMESPEQSVEFVRNVVEYLEEVETVIIHMSQTLSHSLEKTRAWVKLADSLSDKRLARVLLNSLVRVGMTTLTATAWLLYFGDREGLTLWKQSSLFDVRQIYTPVSVNGVYFRTPLSIALCHSNTKCSEVLIDDLKIARPADLPYYLNFTPNGGATTKYEAPIHSASRMSVEAVNALLELGATLEARDDTGRTPLLVAIDNFVAFPTKALDSSIRS
jgi:hypothetical protein